jgi:hypothetical protein
MSDLTSMQHGHSRTFMMSCLTRSASSTCLRFVPLVGGVEGEPSSVVDERSCITGAMVWVLPGASAPGSSSSDTPLPPNICTATTTGDLIGPLKVPPNALPFL